ncbi:protein of unknown function [Cupriavidus neocaledonicus]|uniref:Uncharacterized protein n=1 Tax=Cupriavidus neocaledonicus TaxID=1040979 RepID=A0A375H334_9BURK|nr:hypothetical protein CBM2605_A70090 [Cupriavidus neocaledonicus]SPD46062.1 protein of unknown function [Cupriavidus neocaledonicus]
MHSIGKGSHPESPKTQPTGAGGRPRPPIP